MKSKYGSLLKSFLHTKLGARVGFRLGLRGFNRVGVSLNDTFLGYSYNARVNVGAQLTASLLTGTSISGMTSPLAPVYIALSGLSITAAATDTTLYGETAGTGLTRATGSVISYTAPTALDGAASYVLQHTFTNNTGGSATITSTALFDKVSGGNMFAETNLSTAATLAVGDTVTITWTVNI